MYIARDRPAVAAIVAILITTSTIAGAPILLHKNAFAFSLGSILNLSETAGDSSIPQIAAFGGNVYVVWQDGDVAAEEIFFSVSTDGGSTFSEPVNISNSPEDSQEPQIAALGNNVYIAWSEVNDDPNADIFFAASENNGTDFTIGPDNISGTAEDSSLPEIAVSSSDIYVLWEEEDSISGYTEIFFAASSDGGDSFSSVGNLSNSDILDSSEPHVAVSAGTAYTLWKEFDDILFLNNVYFATIEESGGSFNVGGLEIVDDGIGDVAAPQMLVSNDNVYVAWNDPVINLDTFFAVRESGNTTFNDPNNISLSGTVFASGVDIAASGSDVYVVWRDDIDGNTEIYFAGSTNNGIDFTMGPDNISNSDPAVSFNPRIAASGGNIYIVWQEDDPADVFFSVSSDGGSTFSEPVNISNSNSVGVAAFNQMTAVDDSLHIVWEDDSPGNFDIFARTITDSGPPSISIESVSNSSPRWGLDSVEVSGIVNGNTTDTITIDWDDGNSDTIAVDGNSWGPISHTYDSLNTGTKEITSTLLDELDTFKADDSTEIDVQPHETSLSIDNIFSVEEGTIITATGDLIDTDASNAVAGATITFNGTGVGNLLDASTDATGDYSSSGASASAGDLLTVQAHYAGNSSYLLSDSEIISYDAVLVGTDQFDVFAGSPSEVTLTEYNASIVFDSVLADGIIYVSECDAPGSTRYEEITDMCLSISIGISLEEGSGASITMSYDGLTIPAGYSEDDTDLFHDGLSGILDITESRDTEANTVTGRTTDFSKFIGGAALHSAAPDGEVRQQVFVGDNNDLIFNLTQPKTVEIDGELTIGNIESVTVTDPDANLDSDEIETVEVNITSTSDPVGITIELEESGEGTGIFEGSFLLTDQMTSSNAQARLFAELGDEISALYDPFMKAPFRVIIEGVTESGLAQVTSIETTDTMSPVGNAYELSLIDATLGPNANVTVILSYENVNVTFDESNLRMFLIDSVFCVDGITYPGGTGLDTDAMTLKGNTTTAGQFILSLSGESECVGGGFAAGPGGSAGGLPRPGTGGLLLDVLVAVAEDSDDNGGSNGGGGGGGGGNRVVVIRNEPSPLAAIVETFPDSYFEGNPLSRIKVSSTGFKDADGNEISEAQAGQQISIAGTFTNQQQRLQQYSFIVMIIDEDGTAVDIDWEQGIVGSGQTEASSISWMPQEEGNYAVKMFVWDGFDNPLPLSESLTRRVSVG